MEKMDIEDESFLSLNNGLRTSNEGINQRNLEMWAHVGPRGRQNMLRPYLKMWEWEWIFGPCSEGDFLTGRPLVSALNDSNFSAFGPAKLLKKKLFNGTILSEA